MKESFTNWSLISRSLSGDREAIIDVCSLVVSKADISIADTFFIDSLKKIGKGVTPDGAFQWEKKELRKLIGDEARNLLKACSVEYFHNDKDLFYFVTERLRGLMSGRSPNESFGWNQKRRGKRKNTTNGLRDWNIRMTIYTLMSEPHNASFRKACKIVADSITDEEASYDTIAAIGRGVTATDEPEFPEDLFPISKTNKLRIDSDRLEKNVKIILSQ
jgi:hypothetical protein